MHCNVCVNHSPASEVHTPPFLQPSSPSAGSSQRTVQQLSPERHVSVNILVFDNPLKTGRVENQTFTGNYIQIQAYFHNFFQILLFLNIQDLLFLTVIPALIRLRLIFIPHRLH